MATGKYQKWLTPDGLMLLAAWARDGLSNDQIARKCGISRQTLNEWRKAYPDISDALSRGKEPVDVEVENALYKLALGYTEPVAKTFKVKEVYFDERGRRCEREHLVTGYDEVHIPANVNAQKFWLANRKPEVWRERQQSAEGCEDALQRAREILGGVRSVIQ